MRTLHMPQGRGALTIANELLPGIAAMYCFKQTEKSELCSMRLLRSTSALSNFPHIKRVDHVHTSSESVNYGLSFRL